jgi:hypothetical protein
VQDGFYAVGQFSEMTETDFYTSLVRKFEIFLLRITTDINPAFDLIWPQVLNDFILASENLADVQSVEEPTTPGWDVVRNYFCHELTLDSSRIFILRCLLAEYIHGVLDRFGHPDISDLRPLTRSDAGHVGRMISQTLLRLRSVDFRPIFDDGGIANYRELRNVITRERLSSYISSITTPPQSVRMLARDRLDRNEFLADILYALHHGEQLDNRGKVPTDPELAALLSAMTIVNSQAVVLDPCCGDGALLEAAYSRLRTLGLSYNESVQNLHGIEVDPALARLAFLRITLQEPAQVSSTVEPKINQGDMFSSTDTISSANTILMNPPFRRYENHDPHPLPEQLKHHYSTQISAVTGQPSIAVSGQQNLFTYHVEHVIAAAQQGCRIGVILDNKWYHNNYAAPLRKYVLQNTAIDAVIEYPYANLFASWTIATSIMICTKANPVPVDHTIKFLRCSLDLAQVDLASVQRFFAGLEPLPAGWTCREILQSELDPVCGWKNSFADVLSHDYLQGLPFIPELFQNGRRGSLAKEEGGMSALAFPFDCRSFGSLREAHPRPQRRYQNQIIRKLTNAENAQLQQLAGDIDISFRGYAINNSHVLNSYILTVPQVQQQQTIEPPAIRGHNEFWSDRKVSWQPFHEQAIAEMEASETVSVFISQFRRLTGLDETLMPNEWLFVGLREPYAGDLIIPRKMRSAHRVHVNPFACNSETRQIRLSSNFISFSNCIALDADSNLNRIDAVRLIASFLVSSFGQLQFETIGYNREGCLSVELHHLERIHIFDPRLLTQGQRTSILSAFDALPYPVSSELLSSELLERNVLDNAWADALCCQHEGWIREDLLTEVHSVLDEFIFARKP